MFDLCYRLSSTGAQTNKPIEHFSFFWERNCFFFSLFFVYLLIKNEAHIYLLDNFETFERRTMHDLP